MNPTLCEQLITKKDDFYSQWEDTPDRIAIIDKINEDGSFHVSHILDEHQIINDVRFADLSFMISAENKRFAPVYVIKTRYREDEDTCMISGFQLRLERLVREKPDHFLAFLWKCERDAAAAARYAAHYAAYYAARYAAVADAAAAARYAAVAAADAAAAVVVDAIADADAEWHCLNDFLVRLEQDAFGGVSP